MRYLLSLFICCSVSIQVINAQCTAPINSNSALTGSIGEAYVGSPYYAYTFLGENCAGNDGPVIANWHTAFYTPDAVPGQYVTAQIQRNIPGNKEAYESFYTTADLTSIQPNTTYFYSFEIAMKHFSGTTLSLLEVIQRNNTSGFTNECSVTTIVPLPAANGNILFSKVISPTCAYADIPVFVKVCGNFTTGATVASTNILWFRFSFDNPTSNSLQHNYNYIRNFNIYPCAVPNVTAAAECQSICTIVNPLLAAEYDICNNTPVTLDAQNTGATYLWSTGAATQTISTATEGEYWVDITTSACSLRVYTQVNTNDPINIGNDQTVCSGKSILLTSPVTGNNYSYLWSNGSTDSSITVTEAGVYHLSLTHNGCTEQSNNVTVHLSGSDHLIPNLITRNKDNKNDVLIINQEMLGGQLTIINKWGTTVYKNNNYQNEFNGENLSDGIYYYHYSDLCGVTKKGWVEILSQ